MDSYPISKQDTATMSNEQIENFRKFVAQRKQILEAQLGQARQDKDEDLITELSGRVWELSVVLNQYNVTFN